MHNNIHKHAFFADFVHATRINSQQNQEGLNLTTTFESLAQKQGHEATLLDCVFLDKSGLLQYLGVYSQLRPSGPSLLAPAPRELDILN